MPVIPGEVLAVLLTAILGAVGFFGRRFIDNYQKNKPAQKEYDFFITPLKEEISRIKIDYSNCLLNEKELNKALDLLRAENLKLETQLYVLQREVNKLNYELDSFYNSP